MGPTDSRVAVTPASALDAARRELLERDARAVAGRSRSRSSLTGWTPAGNRSLRTCQRRPSRSALLALGGYGRRQLCLHSDVDLLVLFDGPIGPEDERFVRGLLNPLWDLGLMLGHQVRELADFARLETDNPEFLLALLDARLMAGDPSLFARLQRRLSPAGHARVPRSSRPSR